jgi:hypothetical protein
MNTDNLQKQFARMGARLAVFPASNRFAVDVRRDRRGSLFEVIFDQQATRVCALDVQPRQRHLLLVVQRPGAEKFLCGHDERDWFAAAVPRAGGVSSVRAAMDALKPSEVRAALNAKHVKRQHRDRRRNAAFIRQGEWFFIPQPGMTVDPLIVRRNEPLIRGRGKAPWVEFLCRTGGEVAYFSNEYPNGLSEIRYRRLLAEKPAKSRLKWRVLRRNPEVYACGKVRHPDHKTIFLDGWYRVLVNTENEAPSMRHLAFLD